MVPLIITALAAATSPSLALPPLPSQAHLCLQETFLKLLPLQELYSCGAATFYCGTGESTGRLKRGTRGLIFKGLVLEGGRKGDGGG